MKRDMSKMMKLVGKVAKLDLGLGYVEYVRR